MQKVEPTQPLMNPFSCVLTNPAINVQSSIQKAANKYI